MLAILTQALDRPSETFIRDHIRHVAPDRTVVVSGGTAGADGIDAPVLSGVDLHTLPDWVRIPHKHFASHLWAAFIRDGLTAEAEDRVIAFFERHKVRAAMAEYLTLGVLFQRTCQRAGVRLYAHAHGADATSVARDPLWRRRYRRLFSTADGLIAPSRFIAERLVSMGCPQAQVSVSPCGIDPTVFTKSQRRAGRILSVGRFVEKKAPHHTLAAFAKITARHPQARLDCIGDGPLLSDCRALAARLGIADRVVFHGAQPAGVVRLHLQNAAIFAQHSVVAPNGDMEGLPVAILEAMASGVPVVSTRHSGIPEAVIDHETGYLFDEHDVESMADAFDRLLTQPDLAAAMGDAGARRARTTFTHAHTRDRLLKAMALDTVPVREATTNAA